MARNLTSIPDIKAPDAEYPVGRIQNEETTPVAITGTPVIEELYGDIVQFFHKLLRLAGISHNDLPENETTGFQFITALAAYVRTVTASTELKGVAELATNAETQAGIDTLKVITPAGLASRSASTTRTGIAELATNTETQTGTDSTRIVTPAGLESKTATQSRAGIAKIASNIAIDSNTDDSMIITPLGAYRKQTETINIINGYNAQLRTTIVEIGDWNMDITASVNIPLSSFGLADTIDGAAKIRDISVLIRSDVGDIFSLTHPYNGSTASWADGNGRWEVTDAVGGWQVNLVRRSGGHFDEIGFDQTSYNRGWITIKHLP